MYTRPVALKLFSLMGVFPVCVHEMDRKDAEQTVQYVYSDQVIFLDFEAVSMNAACAD